MGAEFNFDKLNAKNDADAIIEVQGMIEHAKYDSGHGGYTGTLAEADGAVIKTPDEPIKDESDAEEWLDNHAPKWGPALIIKDAAGEYYSGACCSS